MLIHIFSSEGLASSNAAFCGSRLAARLPAAFTVIRTQSRMPPPPPHSSWSSPSVAPSLPPLSVSCRPPACQLGALTSSPSSSRRRSICLLGWQVSMQLFATLHIGSFRTKLDPPTMPGGQRTEQNSSCSLPACPSATHGRGVRRETAAVGPVRPAVRCSGSAAMRAALVHSWQPEVHKNLKWAKVRWRLDMRGGLCCRGARRERSGAPLARSPLLPLPSPADGDVRLQRVMSSAIREFHLSSLPSP